MGPSHDGAAIPRLSLREAISRKSTFILTLPGLPVIPTLASIGVRRSTSLSRHRLLRIGETGYSTPVLNCSPTLCLSSTSAPAPTRLGAAPSRRMTAPIRWTRLVTHRSGAGSTLKSPHPVGTRSDTRSVRVRSWDVPKLTVSLSTSTFSITTVRQWPTGRSIPHRIQCPWSVVTDTGVFANEEIPDLAIDNSLRTGRCHEGDGDGDVEGNDSRKAHMHFHKNTC